MEGRIFMITKDLERLEILNRIKEKHLKQFNAAQNLGISIPKELEKSVFRFERKLPRIDDRRLRKLIRINAIRTKLRSSIIGDLAKPKSRFFRFFGYNQSNVYCQDLQYRGCKCFFTFILKEV